MMNKDLEALAIIKSKLSALLTSIETNEKRVIDEHTRWVYRAIAADLQSAVDLAVRELQR